MLFSFITSLKVHSRQTLMMSCVYDVCKCRYSVNHNLLHENLPNPIPGGSCTLTGGCKITLNRKINRTYWFLKKLTKIHHHYGNFKIKWKFSPKWDNYASMTSWLCKNCFLSVKIIGKTKSLISNEEKSIKPLHCLQSEARL